MDVESREFTLEELAAYDGQNGAPAFISYRGLVYDVSLSRQWRRGRHHKMHQAGCDLTNGLAFAPHGEGPLRRFPVVGRLVGHPLEAP